MKLQLGCGKRIYPGYVHVDVVEHPHIDLRCAIDRMPMLADNSAEVINACHVLEHFHRRDVDRVLREWHRILKPGGTLRVAVPHFEKLIALYEQTGKLELIIGPLFGRQDYLYNIHYNVFDQRTLFACLIENGFRHAKLYDWRKTDHADVDDYSQSYYPHMDKENGLLLSLNVEATKP